MRGCKNLKRLKLDTEGGVTVLTPAERVDDGVVSIEGNVGETAKITVTIDSRALDE